jgi:three-Cys-motif partner protein
MHVLWNEMMSSFGGAWSEQKLRCVEAYTESYLKVMQRQSWATLHYVDAFAGRGKQQLPNHTVTNEDEGLLATASFLEGSALRALKVSSNASRGFDKFLFIEASRSASHQLVDNINTDYPSMAGRVDVLRSDANEAISSYVDQTDWSRTRGLIFLDPFGLEVRWETIVKLASTKACDVWYLFPLVGVIRMMTNTGEIDTSWKIKLNSLFGTDSWYDEFYPAAQFTLFGDVDKIKDAKPDHILEYLRARLGTVFAAVSKAAVLCNSRGFPLFALVMGVSNPNAKTQALRICNHLIDQLSSSQS